MSDSTGTRSALLAVLVTAVIVCRARAAETLQVTPDCGAIGFVGSKNDGRHVGGFKGFSGTVHLVPDDPGASHVALEIQTGSLWSDNPKLTDHLRNADFFHVDRFPKAVFRSTAVRQAGPEDRRAPGHDKVTHVLTGKLTLLGVSQEMKLPVSIGLADDALTIQGIYQLDRTRFGMDYGLGKIHKAVRVTFALKIPRKRAGT